MSIQVKDEYSITINYSLKKVISDSMINHHLGFVDVKFYGKFGAIFTINID